MSLRWKSSLTIILGSILKKSTFLLVRYFFILVQKIVWKFNGTSHIVERNLHPPKSGDAPVAHRMNIVASCKPCMLQPASLKDFILTHDEYVDPMYVTQHDHISLFFIDPHTNLVVFGEALPGQLMWRKKYAPIIFISQFKYSQKLIIMQISDFGKVCEALPDPEKPLIFLGNTARCGSTILTQVFEETGKVITTSESYPLVTLTRMFLDEGMTEDVLSLTRHVIRYYCRPIQAIPDPAGYILKPTGPASIFAQVVKKLYPDVKVFYMYRNMDNVAKSLYKVSFVWPSLRFLYIVAQYSRVLFAKFCRESKWALSHDMRVLGNAHSIGVFIGVNSTANYKELIKKSGVHGLSFDDVLRDKRIAVRAIFKVCGLSEDLVKPAMNAFLNDSQGNSVGSRENLAEIKDLEVTDEDRMESNDILLQYGYPPLDQETRLPGTLHFNKVLHENVTPVAV